MTPKELADIKARADAATPGPWRYSDGCLAGNLKPTTQDCIVHEQIHETNAAFIAAARTDIPRLLEYVEELRAALKACESGSCDGCNNFRYCPVCNYEKAPTYEGWEKDYEGHGLKFGHASDCIVGAALGEERK